MTRRFSAVFPLLLLFAALADRGLKSLALAGVTAQAGIFRFVLWRNHDLVFSVPMPPIIGILLIVSATFCVVWLSVRYWQRHHVLDLGTSFMILGAASNLYDRWRFGFVIDWAYLGPWWPVFNLADVCVAVGLLIYLRRQIR